MSEKNGTATPVDQVERQATRAALYTHAALDKLNRRISALEELVSSMVGGLLESGSLSYQDFAEVLDDPPPAAAHAGGEVALEDTPLEEQPLKEIPWPAIAMRIEGEDEAVPGAPVDCAARLHICQSVCCRLGFPLSPEEIEGGKVKWDLGHPYLIRHERNGYCTHNDRDTGFCHVYDDRPAVCRRYSCVNDQRIWKDFENMVLNEEWIAENLANPRRDNIYFVRRPRMEEVS